METVADLVAAGRDRDGVVLSVPGRTTDYRYDDFCTSVWKSGNLLRHYGLRAGAAATVAVGSVPVRMGSTMANTRAKVIESTIDR